MIFVHNARQMAGVQSILFSEKVGANKLHRKDRSHFYERFIVWDYGTADERVFLCGSCPTQNGASFNGTIPKKYADILIK